MVNNSNGTKEKLTALPSITIQDNTDTDSSSSSSSEGHAKSPVEEPIAPDGGYAWVVLVASFFSSVIVDGVCFSFGIFLLEYLSYFGEPRGKTAWVGSVLNGTYMIMGPIAGALANKFGCRRVAIVGGVWASVAFFLSTFSNNVNTLIFTYGVLGGIGFGLLYLPSIVVVGFYFDKRRAFATGVATCGSGIGAFLFAPLSKALIDIYSWKGAQWIISGIVLNGVVLGAFYRPLTIIDIQKYQAKWRRKEQKKREKELKKQQRDNECIDMDDIDEDIIYCKEQNLSDTDKKKLSPQIQHRVPETGSWTSLSAYASVESLTDANGNNLRKRVISKSQLSLHNTDDHIPTSKETEGGKESVELVADLWNNVKNTMDVTMLSNPVFVIYGFSCILCMAGFFVPFIYLPDHTISLGYDPGSAAFLLSILGITNTVGRVITGWVSDRPWADCLLINNIALILGGIATIFCPFCTTYYMLAMYACVFGLCIAAFVSLRSIILVDLIGLDNLTSSFGIIVLCQGITSFLGAPIAGWMYDITNSYDLSFYVAGTTIALAGVICLPLRQLAKCREESNQKKHIGT